MSQNRKAVLGIDAGSRTIKAVLLSLSGSDIIASGVRDQGVHQAEIAGELAESIMKESGISRNDIAFTVATGYGRNMISSADTTFSEITCHAKGVLHQNPDIRTVIDIGGQDSKMIKLDDNGHVHDFAMNDRCAAGTGRFLEVVAQRLEISPEELDDIAAHSSDPCIISSTCVVFAETEIVGLLAQGRSPADITAGIFSAIASRLLSMAGRKTREPAAFTGGAALFRGLHNALEQTLGLKIETVHNPRLTGALGAAVIAKEKAGK